MLHLSARAAKTSVVSALALGLLLSTATEALAAKPSSGKTQPASGAMSLVSDSNWNNPNSPSWCLNEDDYDQPVYSGSLSGSMSASEQLCGLSSDYYNGAWWDAGGIGVETDIYFTGQLSDLSIAAPDGTAHHAVLVGQSTSKGQTTYHYAACYVPAYSSSTDTGGTPLPGGTWGISLSGQVSNARWSVRAQMTDVRFQQTYCPASQQNVVS
ncbi:MAG TPA: hypothetical protein VFH54_16935 [Mycobacteriales bacterium]|nr:hypothetical protein [Mycobacteriales bacterium]